MKSQPKETTTVVSTSSPLHQPFDLLVNAVTDYAIFMLDPQGYIATWNAGAERAKGYKASEIIGKHFSIFYTPEDRASGRWKELLQRALQQGRVEDEGWRVRKDGSRFWADVIITPVYDSNGQLRNFAKVTRDVTERRLAEETIKEKQRQIVELQRLEATGRLAGGVAHDFNNLVSGIMGCAEAIARLHPAADIQEEVTEIQKACERAAKLTRQLMAFGGRQVAKPQVLNFSAIVRELENFIQRLLTADIQLQFHLSAQPCFAKADRGQIEQILLNLILNSRDAMPKGGVLDVRTDRITLDHASTSETFEIQPGEYTMLSISDTGTGMTPDVRARIFEPFFTTKEVGKGTGLGLATVYGIVKQNSGAIHVHSAPNIGTVVKVFLPAVSSEGTPETGPAPRSKAKGGLENPHTILVVEDDSLVLRNTVRSLQSQGYTVLSAANGDEALIVIEKLKGKLDLLITDVIMPGMNGKQLVDKVTPQLPDLKVIYMSGYTADVIARHGLLNSSIAFLEKPFGSGALFAKVDEVLRKGTSH